MTVLEWSPKQRLTVELRKNIRAALRAGAPSDFAVLSPMETPQGLSVPHHESPVALVRNRRGRRFLFSSESLYVECPAGFERVTYDSISACNWIVDEPHLAAKARLKSEHGDRLILHGVEGVRYELDHLGWSFQGLHNFFCWLLRRRERAVQYGHAEEDGGEKGRRCRS